MQSGRDVAESCHSRSVLKVWYCVWVFFCQMEGFVHFSLTRSSQWTPGESKRRADFDRVFEERD